MPVVDSRPLRGWRFLLLNIVLGLGNVLVLSNVPGYTIARALCGGQSAGRDAELRHLGDDGPYDGHRAGLSCSRVGSRRGLAITACLSRPMFFTPSMSLFCAMSDTIYFFVASRILLGLAGGVILPVGQSVLLDEYPEKLRTFGVGLWGVLSMMPFMVGTYLGGWYSEFLGWRFLFYSNIPVALLAAGVVGSLLYGRGCRRRFPRFDFVGFFLLAAILLGLQTIFNMGNDFDWLHSPILVGALIVVVLALPCFVIWELGERHPAIDMRLFAHRNYAIATICSVVGFFVIQGSLSLFIAQMQLLLGYSSSLAGGVYLSMLLLSVPSAAIVHELCKHVDVRLICCLNFLGFAATLTWLGLFDKTASFDQIAWPMTFFGFSLAMFFAPHGESRDVWPAGRAADARGGGVRAAAHGRRRLWHRAARRGAVPAHALSRARSFRRFGGRRFSELDLMTQLTDRLEPLGFTPGHGDQSGRALSAAGGGVAGARTTPFCSAPSCSSDSPPSFGSPAPPIPRV